VSISNKHPSTMTGTWGKNMFRII